MQPGISLSLGHISSLVAGVLLNEMKSLPWQSGTAQRTPHLQHVYGAKPVPSPFHDSGSSTAMTCVLLEAQRGNLSIAKIPGALYRV